MGLKHPAPVDIASFRMCHHWDSDAGAGTQSGYRGTPILNIRPAQPAPVER